MVSAVIVMAVVFREPGIGGDGSGRRRWLAVDAAYVEKECLLLAQDEGQTLGDSVLADARPAIDEDERSWRRIDGTAKDAGARSRGRCGQGRTVIGGGGDHQG